MISAPPRPIPSNFALLHIIPHFPNNSHISIFIHSEPFMISTFNTNIDYNNYVSIRTSTSASPYCILNMQNLIHVLRWEDMGLSNPDMFHQNRTVCSKTKVRKLHAPSTHVPQRNPTPHASPPKAALCTHVRIVLPAAYKTPYHICPHTPTYIFLNFKSSKDP